MGNRYEVIVTTHLNTKCLHNHFVINSVSYIDGKKFNSNRFSTAMEVLGDTGQHWGAIMNVLGDEIKIVDPSSNNIDVWSTYNWKNSSQFLYFQALG